MPEGDGLCALGFMPCEDATYILGDTFLRSAYAVHGLVNNQVGWPNQVSIELDLMLLQTLEWSTHSQHEGTSSYSSYVDTT